MVSPDAGKDAVVGGCYRLTRQLGRGGMGTVYEAQHLRLGGKVAIKILSPQFANDPRFRARFKREARAASKIRHPNVVQITDYGETPSGSVFFAMELLEGRDLHAILRERIEPLPWPRARHLLAQAADGLAAAHAQGIIHRDVKPANVFVLQGEGIRDFVKILDFGIAKIFAPYTEDSVLIKNLTTTGEVFGTAKYMAPEQVHGKSNDARMDMYALGVVAYEILTGRVPFNGRSAYEIIAHHMRDAPPSLRAQQPSIPAALEAVILRALQKQPDDRFATMEAFAWALRAFDESSDASTNVLNHRRRSKTVPMTSPAHAHAHMRQRRDYGIQTAAEPAPAPKHRAFGAYPRALGAAPSPTQRTTHPAPQEVATGPLGMPYAVEVTKREEISTPPRHRTTKTWRFWSSIGLLALGTSVLSVMAALHTMNERDRELHAEHESSGSALSDDLATAPMPRDGLVESSSRTAPEQPPAENTPDHGSGGPVLPSPPRSARPKAPKSAKRRARPSQPPKPRSDQQLKLDLAKKVMRQCDALGTGNRVKIILRVEPSGRLSHQEIDAEGSLARCVRRALGTPVFSGQNPKIMLNPMVGTLKPDCNNPFEGDDPHCKR